MTPSGVKKFGHKSQSTKGSFHPDKIGSGLATTDSLGGSHPPAMEAPGKGSGGPPRGVVRGDGTEKLQGTKVTKKRGSGTPAPGKGSTHWPGEVRKHSGTKAPKSVKS